MNKATFFYRNGGIVVTMIQAENTPASIGQRMGGGFIVGRDSLWGKEREIIINLSDIRTVIIEKE